MVTAYTDYLEKSIDKILVLMKVEECKMLSLNAKRIYNEMKKIYIEYGYMYSGCVGFCEIENVLESNDYKEIFKIIVELIDNKLIQKRDCDGFALELTIEEKKLLILENNLDIVWQEKAPYFYPNEDFGEVKKVLNYAN